MSRAVIQSADITSAGVASVEDYETHLKELLRRRQLANPIGSIEPILSVEDFGDGIVKIGELSHGWVNKSYAAIETACRNIFYDILALTNIEDSAFGEVWNLFDIVSILSDLEYCEPGLIFWLVEELLDSQTIEGCRIVFDYLDSRRERITAKHFKQKNLIILRACNELLRRLSRAEDTVFCGRVFIFLFQSFPLGDRSSVNLRGEYHVENITTFEDIQFKGISNANGMAIDQKESIEEAQDIPKASTPLPASGAQNGSAEHQGGGGPKSVKLDQEGIALEAVPDMDSLYSVFWSLQGYFSQPTKLFEGDNLTALKAGLQSTMAKFKEMHREQRARGNTKLSVDDKRGLKRKRNGKEDELSNSFNPKYLTSRDLFELEVSDLAFRRHILVQALILIDFLLSLTPKAKKKLKHTSNKSVLYSYTLDDENTKWANNIRSDIATYLQQGTEGKFYHRMVDTVLSRDKNWVHWKAEGCPPIARPAVSAENFAEAVKGAEKACTDRKIRPTPMGTLDLTFLSGDTDVGGMELLRNPDRYTVPTIGSFKDPIVGDDLDIEMAKNDEEKQLATGARASKLWRALRIASKSKLAMFDKIDDGNNLEALFEPDVDESKEKAGFNRGEDAMGEQSAKGDLQEGRQQISGDVNGAHTVQEKNIE
ncbi:MAG: hypothetical protein Q9163_000355 [Psora crenata]